MDWTVTIADRDWYLGSGTCCYSKYFAAGLPEMDIAKVKVYGKKAAADVTEELEGPFAVFYYNASPLGIGLSDGAEEYIEGYIIEAAGDGKWDADADGDGTPYEIEYYTDEAALAADVGTVVDFGVLLDPKDLSILFLLPSYMTYTFTAEVEPVSVEVVLDDVCTGMQFKEVTITLTDLSLCCGITYDAELHFTKCEGFDYAKFSADLFEICCGISFGVDVTFGVDYKKVEPKFSWTGIEGCVTVWGDLQEKVGEVGVEGWELYGYKIFCELAECYSLEFVTAFNVSKVEDIIGDVFKGDEFEYIAIGACGPACCGGTWTLDATIYFDNAGGLFGASRLTVDTEVPIMDALTLSFSFESPDTISVGWEFTF